MIGKMSQKEYWNSRSQNWHDHDEPLVPGQPELEFQEQLLVPGGSTLVLGVTPQLCELAFTISKSVTSVDFAIDLIEALGIDGVEYVCQDWIEFLRNKERDGGYDNILTDGGLLALSFPEAWNQMSTLIYDNLRPGGIFCARIYLSTENPPKKRYDNPSLERFVSSIGDIDENWMVHPLHPAYANYDIQYTFPPKDVVMRVFSHFILEDEFVPGYEEGDRFVTFAFRRPR